MPIQTISPSQASAMMRTQLAAGEYLQRQRAARQEAQFEIQKRKEEAKLSAVRFQAAQEYEALQQQGVPSGEAFRRLAPRLFAGNPQGLANAARALATGQETGQKERLRIEVPTPEGGKRRISAEEYAFEQANAKAEPLLKKFQSLSRRSGAPIGIGRTSFAQQASGVAKDLADLGFDTSGNVLPSSPLHRQIATDPTLANRLNLPPTQVQLAQSAARVGGPVLPPGAPAPTTAYQRWLASVGGPGRPRGATPANQMYFIDQAGQRQDLIPQGGAPAPVAPQPALAAPPPAVTQPQLVGGALAPGAPPPAGLPVTRQEAEAAARGEKVQRIRQPNEEVRMVRGKRALYRDRKFVEFLE